METTTHKKGLPAWLVLCIIAVIAGGLLGGTNLLTQSRIKEQIAITAEAVRKQVLPEASSFNKLAIADDAIVDYCYEGINGGVVGYVCQVTTTGYHGDIEVTVGLNTSGGVTGISVGGASFSETPGLGAKVKEPNFTDQFTGLITPLAVVQDGGDVDSITGATRSSRAVANAVNAAAQYISTIGG
ncbi:MAG: RnfABCDGE type electron transport complex subunit G [Clostridia bacterium]